MPAGTRGPERTPARGCWCVPVLAAGLERRPLLERHRLGAASAPRDCREVELEQGLPVAAPARSPRPDRAVGARASRRQIEELRGAVALEAGPAPDLGTAWA